MFTCRDDAAALQYRKWMQYRASLLFLAKIECGLRGKGWAPRELLFGSQQEFLDIYQWLTQWREAHLIDFKQALARHSLLCSIETTEEIVDDEEDKSMLYTQAPPDSENLSTLARRLATEPDFTYVSGSQSDGESKP
ncbi:hypothetical protein LTR64_008393 [Lithohypha guttulata]|uniref:uncharacterized protein n=1 Tax=Lithohypha guttulata TaxID=1690604 RepID=UPI002DE122B3|nr:hypothetical protein LTR51_008561 [Lithohypha guttulata]